MARRDRVRRANIIALALLALGTTQMLGYVAGSGTLQRLAAATVMSPLPKAFGDVDGLEPFASDFTLGYWEPNGTEHFLRITPELYTKLMGPHDRRNVYATALSHAPRMPESLWQPVFCYGLARTGPLRRELGLRPDYRDLALTVKTTTAGRTDSWTYAPSCTR